MTVYSVDSGQVASCASRIQVTCDSIRGEVSALMHELLALKDSWQGAASAQFSESVSSWQTTQAQVETSLDQISTSISPAALFFAEAYAQFWVFLANKTRWGGARFGAPPNGT